MKKIVILSDSFKGTLDSKDIGRIAKEETLKLYPGCEVIALPIADGGEGTVDCFLAAMNGEKIPVVVSGPLGDSVTSFYGKIGKLAVVEMASAAGLPLLEGKLDPYRSSTYGVGETIRRAVEEGCNEVVIGLGGSATNDGGCGMGCALGVVFRDERGQAFIPTGETLHRISDIDVSESTQFLEGVKITAMADITNPLHVKTGAAYVFAPQKGADTKGVKLLDDHLIALDLAIQKALDRQVSDLPGAGAAGGMGAGVVAFLGGRLKSGIETVLEKIEFDRLIKGADFIVTGEGKLDGQSMDGKAISGVAKASRRQNVPVIAIVGSVEDDEAIYEIGVNAIFTINRKAMAFEKSKYDSAKNYRHTFANVLRLIKATEENTLRRVVR